MKIHRELELHGDRSAVFHMLDAISAEPAAGWSRNSTAEQELKRMASEQICFECTNTAARRQSRLWIAWREDKHLAYVTNIVPTRGGGLSINEYNAILEDFTKSNKLEERSARAGIRVLLSPQDVDLQYWHLNPRTVELLKYFSDAANKSTGSSHPLDRERWFHFLIAAHKDKATLDTSILGRWLCDEQGWPEDTASDLRIEYEFARELLNAYDRTRQ